MKEDNTIFYLAMGTILVGFMFGMMVKDIIDGNGEGSPVAKSLGESVCDLQHKQLKEIKYDAQEQRAIVVCKDQDEYIIKMKSLKGE